MPGLTTTLAALVVGVVLAAAGFGVSLLIARGKAAPGTWTASRTDPGFVLMISGLIVVIATSGLAAYLLLTTQ